MSRPRARGPARVASACALAAATLLAPAHSRADRTVTLGDVLELAERRSLELRLASVRVDIAKAQRREARLGWVPELAASTGFKRTDGQVQGSFGDFRDVDFQSVTPYGLLSWALNPAETYFRSDAASQREQGRRAAELAVRRAVLSRVAQLYYELLRAHAAARVADRALDDARDLLDISDARFRKGSGRGDDVERARAEVASAEDRVLRARQGASSVSIQLAAALNLSSTEALVPADSEPSVRTLVDLDRGLERLTAEAVERHPAIVEAGRLVSAGRADRRAAVSNVVVPTLLAFYEEGATAETYGDLEELRRYGVAATWDLSAAEVAKIGTAGARVREAEVTLATLERGVRAEVAAAYSDARLRQAAIEPARRASAGSANALGITRVRFRNGTSLAIEVIQSQQALEAARLAEQDAIVDYDQAQVRLRAALGDVDPEDLAQAPSSGAGERANPD